MATRTEQTAAYQAAQAAKRGSTPVATEAEEAPPAKKKTAAKKT